MREFAGTASLVLNRVVEAVVVVLMALLVLDVWIGVADRYVFRWQLNWPEILARYLMIWMALLAISCAIARREHIGLSILVDRLPVPLRRAALMLCDVLAIGLFLYVVWYGVGFALGGLNRRAMIFGMSMAPAFAAVPAAAAMSAIQLALCLVRDGGRQALVAQGSEV
ncbi:C4-dicarboxylate ABC transporter permease [Acuticoccus sediminis]|uniref:TRAP transporter small permease protein n=1 Tax=Acuticoccus sediminis TaxID=2184697 RepID=A0A8B2NZM4_9HYPH|nr:TRAP transporter small permease subunit [Acuticoccus sediminis]RAI02020.1 C4-dicarboxylate ABC transporter permease [Acuticoccus sediminis]